MDLDPAAEQEGIDRGLEALDVEVVLGKPDRLEAQFVGELSLLRQIVKEALIDLTVLTRQHPAFDLLPITHSW